MGLNGVPLEDVILTTPHPPTRLHPAGECDYTLFPIRIYAED